MVPDTVKNPKNQFRRSVVFIVDFEHKHLVPLFLLLTLNMKLPSGKELVVLSLCCLLSLCYQIFLKNCFALLSCDRFVSVTG